MKGFQMKIFNLPTVFVDSKWAKKEKLTRNTWYPSVPPPGTSTLFPAPISFASSYNYEFENNDNK